MTAFELERVGVLSPPPDGREVLHAAMQAQGVVEQYETADAGLPSLKGRGTFR